MGSSAPGALRLKAPHQSPLRILVVINGAEEAFIGGLAHNVEAEEEVQEVADAVVEVLRRAGHLVEVLTLGASIAPLGARLESGGVAGGQVDVVFNLVESLGGDAERESEVPALLWGRGVPWTGNGADVLEAAVRKDETRARLERAGVPVPRGFVVDDATPLPDRLEVGYPLFVKPARVDGSIGIDQGSVVIDEAALRARVAMLQESFGCPVVVESYLPGTELNVGLCPDASNAEGGFFAAITMVDFSAFDDGLWPVVTYAGKWLADSPEYRCCSVPAAGRLPAALLDDVGRIARQAAAALGIDGYARVDLRTDTHGRPMVIDVNPNPALHPEAGFARGLIAAGLRYDDVVLSIVEHARTRALRPAALVSPVEGSGPVAVAPFCRTEV